MYIMNIVYLLHVSATDVAINSGVCYTGWIYRDVRTVCEDSYRCKIL